MENTNIEYFDIEDLDTRIIYIHSKEFNEGNKKLALHIKRERSSLAAKLAKELFKRRHNGRVFCEVCSFDFYEAYGDLGEGYIEAHHKKPISKMRQEDVTRIEDFLMVCSNCHSMLHIGEDWITHEQLKKKRISQLDYKNNY